MVHLTLAIFILRMCISDRRVSKDAGLLELVGVIRLGFPHLIPHPSACELDIRTRKNRPAFGALYFCAHLVFEGAVVMPGVPTLRALDLVVSRPITHHFFSARYASATSFSNFSSNFSSGVI
jgi:hypothetical protein